MNKKWLLIIGFFTTGTGFIITGVFVGRATRLMLRYFFSYAISDRLIEVVRLPFLVAGGTMIAISVGIIVLTTNR